MDKQDRVTVTICGRNYYLTAREDCEYIKRIAKKVDKSILDLINSVSGITFEQAAVLTALKYCDDYETKLKQIKKSEKEDENLGKTVVKYSKELSKASARIRTLEKEIDALKQEDRI